MDVLHAPESLIFQYGVELGGTCNSKLVDNEGEPFKVFLFSQHIAADSHTLVRHPQRVNQSHSEFRISCFVRLSRDINPVLL